ncbi:MULTISPECIES: ROK family transcriptional regulator [Streptomyces]|uniref:Transcriptional regulator n=2 Tax=Streptomyces TaxID=1883 RepID=A0A100Y8J2_9ACTN|nr:MULTISPECIES: ROK family transcriptional regulator [Streptomyces]KUH39660.1 transcriptional regulator [Streptomyces kanasensis]UUS30086.1 ROK family transcriptional regulator [Streptomyces changanensis]
MPSAPASPSTARAINDRLALRLLQDEGPLTAAELKRLTGLSRPTVADLVERLQDAGLVRIVGESGAERRGPNARVYGLVADRAHLAALDVRLRGVTVTVTDLLGAPLAEAAAPIGGDTETGPAVERAAALLERTVREAGATRLHTVGIGAPGLVDPATGALRDSAGLPAWHRRLVTALRERLSATVLVENETNLAATAELREGAARDRDTFVLLWLGHGVGAAVVLDGALRRGASGGAGEIGFLPVPGTGALPSATDCAGGFHALAGSAAVRELAQAYGIEAGGPDDEGEPAGASAVRAARERPVCWDGTRAAADPADGGPTGGGPADGGPTGDGPADRCRAYRRVGDGPGDAAGAFLDALAERVALGAAAVTAVLDPGCVVLGGELGHAGGAALAERVEARLATLSPLRTEVRASTLGGAAVLRGALLTARDAAQDELFGGPPATAH